MNLTELSEYAFARRIDPNLPHEWWLFCRMWMRVAFEMWVRERAPLWLSPPPGVPVTKTALDSDICLLHPTTGLTVCRRAPIDRLVTTLVGIATCKECKR